MSVNLVSGAGAALNNPANNGAVAITVLKKAIALQAQSAAQLLQALPSPPSNNLPHLGNHLNTVA